MVLWIFVLGCLFSSLAEISSIHAQEPKDHFKSPASAIETLRISAQTVWKKEFEDDAQLYFFEGGCRVRTAQGEQTGRRAILAMRRMLDGTTDIVVQVTLSGPVTPWVQQLTIVGEPILTADLYRKPPESMPEEVAPLLRRLRGESEPLPESNPVALASGIPSSSADAGIPNLQDRDSRSVQSVQYEQVPPGIAQPMIPPVRTNGLPPAMPVDTPPPTTGALGDGGMQFLIGGTQSVQFMPRGASTPAQIQTMPLPMTNETAVVVRGGATVLVRDVSASLGTGTTMDLGTISISANTIVGWLPALSGIYSGENSLADADGELYMEGDIVFRQGDRVVYADRMYYNISGRYGMILSAEAVTSIPEYEGYVRLKADVLQQVADGRFVAFGAAVTSSRMGVPTYWLQSERVEFQDSPVTRVDPVTGLTVNDREQRISSSQNTVYLGGFPVLYWPRFAGSLEKSNFYLSGFKVKNDSVFGTQVMADWDLFQLFGVEDAPVGVDWTLSTDYLSERGPALGTRLSYAKPSSLGVPGPVIGFADVWAISDEGLDVLGSDRRNLVPERDVRGRALLRHRHYLPGDMELIAEVGLLSDRNFLEQYFENEWDGEKDHDTTIRLQKYYLNNLFDFHADVRLNEFYTETNRLPQLDHYNIGSSWFWGHANWTAHNKVGYEKLEVAEAPTDPIEAAKFTLLPGEFEREGLVAATRQELSAPFSIGVLRLVPYVSGEASYWGEAVDGDELDRLLGQAGLRGSIPAWKIYPTVSSSLLNIRGLAHKVELTGEIFYADSNQNVDDIPLYDPLDDDAQEQFRRRLIFNTFGGVPLPPEFDPRTYAIRNGTQSYVTSPNMEMAEDLLQTRVGFHQRWQTKRGLPGRERIVDLARLDISTLLFLEEDRDNFGETIGPTRYDFRYYAGDRVTLLSDGYFDFFENGLQSVSAGVMSSRPGLGDAYLGILSLEGPISSTVLRGHVDYRLNEKWITSAGATLDLGDTGNVGQQLALTRIGESMLVRLGVTVDAGRDNVGFQFMIEPRFWPGRRLGQLGGQLIPPPGIEGLE